MASLVFLLKHDSRLLRLNASLATIAIAAIVFLFVPFHARASGAPACNPLAELFAKVPEDQQRLLAQSIKEACKDLNDRNCILKHTTEFLERYQLNQRYAAAEARFDSVPKTAYDEMKRRAALKCGSFEVNPDCHKQLMLRFLAEHEEKLAAIEAKERKASAEALEAWKKKNEPPPPPDPAQIRRNEIFEELRTRLEELPLPERKAVKEKLLKLCGPDTTLNEECYKSVLLDGAGDTDSKIAEALGTKVKTPVAKSNVERYTAAHDRYMNLVPEEKLKVEARLKQICEGKTSPEECYTLVLPDVMEEYEGLLASERSARPKRVPKADETGSPEGNKAAVREPVLPGSIHHNTDVLKQLEKFDPMVTVRYDEVHPAPNHPHVDRQSYADDNLLKQFRTTFNTEHHQLVSESYLPTVRPLDTKGSRLRKEDPVTPEGRALWVTGKNTQRMIIPNPFQGDVNLLKLTRGQPIGAGGEVVIENGFVKRMNNRTWPYYPNSEKGLLAEARRIAQDIMKARHSRRDPRIGPDGKREIYTITTGYRVELNVVKATEEEGGRVIEVEFKYIPYEVEKKLEAGGSN